MEMNDHDVVERENKTENEGNADDKVREIENEENVVDNMNESENVGNADDKVHEMENEENVDENMNESENVGNGDDKVHELENEEKADGVDYNMNESENIGNANDKVHEMENEEKADGVDDNMIESESVGNADDKVHEMENDENVDGNMNQSENADDKVHEMENEEIVDDNVNQSENVENADDKVHEMENEEIVDGNMNQSENVENVDDKVHAMENEEIVDGNMNQSENEENVDDKVHAMENEEIVAGNMNQSENVENADDKVHEMENEENVHGNMNESENVENGEDIVNNMEIVEHVEVIVNNTENVESVEEIVYNMENVENIDGKVEEPKVGMKFRSHEDLFNYYRIYSKQLGFAASKKSNKRGDDGVLNYVTIGCWRSGKPRCQSSNKVRSHPESKIDCKAKIRATLCHNKLWRITNVVIEHNHELNPGKTKFYRCSRVTNPHVKRKIELNDGTGITFVVEAGGHENMSFLEKLLWLGVGDATALQDYFMKMQVDNANFFYIIDLDEEGRLRNVFWADARSRAAYEEFGDVVTFDTTYLTNKYNIPLASFVGVNHHGQSTLLGCGLISSEDTTTFTWLFQSWLACMSGRVPNAIITDQDKALQDAIEIVFPSSRHRWCLWHIMKKLPGKLRSHKQYESIKLTLQNIVYDSLSHDVFEESWNQMVEKYNLHNNNWLVGLYSERCRWVPAFVKDTFWAGMSTIQRNESMHAFFDGYVNSKTTLKQFFEQYCNALRSKVEKETHEDSNSFTSKVPCVTRYNMEKQLQDIYTTAKFKEFQHELTEKMYCEVSSFREDDGKLEFEVCEDIIVGEIQKSIIFKVWLHEDDYGVNCICRMFEYRGILCRHVLAVLINRKIYSIPNNYIIHRWRKDVKRCHTRVKISDDDWNVKPEAQRFDSMRNAFCKVADLSAESEDKYNMVMDWISALMEEVHRNVGVCGSNQPTSKSTVQNVNQALLWGDTQRALNHSYGWLGEP